MHALVEFDEEHVKDRPEEVVEVFATACGPLEETIVSRQSRGHDAPRQCSTVIAFSIMKHTKAV